ncbi:MAG: hypothetical protein NZ934_03315 [Hadesarchaea archaeon]|nr:hypothetical protein [Hadesarchaea archaeon]
MRSYLDACDVELFELKGRKLPVAMLGTSPFCGAGQFGSRAELYYRKFYEHPQNMVHLIAAAAKLGVPAVHVVAYPNICRAVAEASKACDIKLCVLGTIGLLDPLDELESLLALDAVGVAVHADIVDRDPSSVERYASAARDGGAAIGVATHRPWKTLRRIRGMDLDFVMAPVNKSGYMMGPRPNETLELLRSLGVPIIAIKPLAAGELKPNEAFEFLSSRVDAVAVGIASEEELIETWQAIKEHFTRREGTW